MTTHDHPTLTGSQDESHTAVAGTPQPSEHTAPAPADPSIASADQSPSPNVRPPAVEEEPNPSASVAPADPSAASGGSTHSGEDPAVSGQHSSVDREASTNDLLFAADDLAELRARWAAVQAAFVDDPEDCVQKADVLVSDLVDQLTSGFANARSRLEEQWGRGEEASTEDLRVALMHYREFFERLLAV